MFHVILGLARLAMPAKLLSRVKEVKLSDLQKLIEKKCLLTKYGGEVEWTANSLRENLSKSPVCIRDK
jgi:hypothetical protein